MTRLAILFTLSLVLASPLSAQDDLFDFIPEGGRSIVERLLDRAPTLADALTQPRDAEAWSALLDDPAYGLDDWTRRTAAEYLAYAGAITDPADLPWDGRDMTLARCQSCHIVTVVVTQARTREAWLGTLNKPSHVEVPLSEAERGQLADYLVVNGGLPIDVIPPALRAGGASY
jgi:mono/diheme cytochrome c family protein